MQKNWGSPKSVLCNVHPLLMMQGKIKELCQKIHNQIGEKKIKDCFMVDMEFQNETFIIKAIKSLSNFINKGCPTSLKRVRVAQNIFRSFVKPQFFRN